MCLFLIIYGGLAHFFHICTHTSANCWHGHTSCFIHFIMSWPVLWDTSKGISKVSCCSLNTARSYNVHLTILDPFLQEGLKILITLVEARYVLVRLSTMWINES